MGGGPLPRFRYDRDTIASKHPLVAPLAALAAGIVAAQYAEFTFRETLISILLLALLAGAGLRAGSPRAGSTACLAAFAFAGAMLASRPAPADPLLITSVLEREGAGLADPIRLRGWVRVPPEPLGDADRFVLEVESVFQETKVRGGVQVNVYRAPDGPPLKLDYGQQVEFLARLRHVRNFDNPGGFDRVRYLRRQGIHMTAAVRPGTPIFQAEDGAEENRGTPWRAWLWKARLAARERLEKLLPEPSTDSSPGPKILRAMLLGDRAPLDRELKEDFQRTGAYHALVISGLHVGVLALFVMALLRLLLAPALPRVIIAFLVVAAYAWLVGASVPASRAAWMFAAYLVTTLVYRQRRALNVVAAVAFCFLAADPEALFDVGFQLSFLAVGLIAGIAMPLLERTIDPCRLALNDVWNEDRDLHVPPAAAGHRVALRMWLEPLPAVLRLPRTVITLFVTSSLRVLVWAAALAVVSCVIQAGLALPMAVYFQRVSWGGLSANLFVMPLLLLAVPTGLLALVSGWHWAVSAAVWAADWMAGVVEWHARHLPVDLRVPPPPLWVGVLFGAALALAALSFERGRAWRWLAGTLVVFSLVLIVAHPFPHEFTPGRLELSALDVGQGESLFLALPGGQTMLIDGGGLPDYGGTVQRTVDIGEAVVSPYLWSRSVKKLDVIAVTHPDADHLAGLPAVINNFRVGEFWVAANAPAGEYGPLIRSFQARGVRVAPLKKGDVRLVGDVRFEVLGPAARDAASWSRNDRSLVLRARQGRHSFLLTGDIESRGEAYLVSEDLVEGASVLKVAHHGSKTSSQERFLDRVRPVFAVISAGTHSPFGHPHPEVLERFARNGIPVLRTDLEGLVSVATDGQRLFVSSSRRERMGRRQP